MGHGGTGQAPHACGKTHLTVATRTSSQVQKNGIGLQSPLGGGGRGVLWSCWGGGEGVPARSPEEKQELEVSRYIAQQRAGQLP